MRKPALALILSTLALMAIPSIVEASASECPVINGKYRKLVTKEDGTQEYLVLTFKTRVENDSYFYFAPSSDEKVWLPADGRSYSIKIFGAPAAVVQSCERGTLIQTVKYEDESMSMWSETRVLNRFEIERKSNYQYAGIFKRQL